jgi:hypothetical protein
MIMQRSFPLPGSSLPPPLHSRDLYRIRHPLLQASTFYHHRSWAPPPFFWAAKISGVSFLILFNRLIKFPTEKFRSVFPKDYSLTLQLY